MEKPEIHQSTIKISFYQSIQVAELMACIAKNRGLSYFKVVEVVAEMTVPLIPLEELLAKIPSERTDIYSPKVCCSFLLLTFTDQINIWSSFAFKCKKQFKFFKKISSESLGVLKWALECPLIASCVI